ncbi:hypothetical protein HK100_004527 [Physocladia obscura]|uniref:Uncharacterized protein n=1 Tax=Physocladia obscura TaxID=109957 RepID=A0AAD5SVA3_9FUNG|nr:hypothetical protein HK100_004527 [Physocladia obscura]
MNLRYEQEELQTQRQPRLNFRDSVETLVDFDESSLEEFLSNYSDAGFNAKDSDTKSLNAPVTSNKISAQASSSSHFGMISDKRAVMTTEDLCDSLKSELDNASVEYGPNSLSIIIATPSEETGTFSDSVASDSDEPEWCSVRRWGSGSDSWSVASSSRRSSLSLDVEPRPNFSLAEIVLQNQNKSPANDVTLSHLPNDCTHLRNRFLVQKRTANHITNNNKGNNYRHTARSVISNDCSSPNNQKASLHSNSSSIEQIANVIHIHHSRSAAVISPAATATQQRTAVTINAASTQNQESVTLKAAGTAAKSVFSSLIGLTKRASGILGTAAIDAFESFSNSQTVATRAKTSLSETPLTAQTGAQEVEEDNEVLQNESAKEQQESASPFGQRRQKEVSFDTSPSSPHLIKSLFKPTQRIIYFIGKASTQKPHSLLISESISPQHVAPLKSLAAEPLESIYDVLQGNSFERAMDEAAILAEEEQEEELARTLLRAKHLGLVFSECGNGAEICCGKTEVAEINVQQQNLKRTVSVSSIATLLIDGQVELTPIPLVFAKVEWMEVEQENFEIA